MEQEQREIYMRTAEPRNPYKSLILPSSLQYVLRFVLNILWHEAFLNKKLWMKILETFSELTVDKTKSVEELKKTLMEKSVLKILPTAGQYGVDRDACGTQIGCVLLQ